MMRRLRELFPSGEARLPITDILKLIEGTAQIAAAATHAASPGEPPVAWRESEAVHRARTPLIEESMATIRLEYGAVPHPSQQHKVNRDRAAFLEDLDALCDAVAACSPPASETPVVREDAPLAPLEVLTWVEDCKAVGALSDQPHDWANVSTRNGRYECINCGVTVDSAPSRSDALAAVRALMKQCTSPPASETEPPVAWALVRNDGLVCSTSTVQFEQAAFGEWLTVVPLYRHPPARPSREREAAAIRLVLDSFDNGTFVRNTDGDADSRWALNLAPYIVALSDLREAYPTLAASPPPTPEPEKP